MKNGIKYAKEIQQMLNQEYFECSLWNIRNGKRASEDCRHIPESFDPVSGRDEFCKKCLGESLEWLNQEYKEPILDDVEKKYLSAVINPFRENVSYISKLEKCYPETDQFIKIMLINGEYICLPYFTRKSRMYIGMEKLRHYTLQELGL